MNEIMQATIINNLKDAKLQAELNRRRKSDVSSSRGDDSLEGLPNLNDIDEYEFDMANLNTTSSSSSSSSSEKFNKANLLKSRDLKTYIKQLKYAKTICEKRLNNFLTPKLNEEEKNDIDEIEAKLKSRKV